LTNVPEILTYSKTLEIMVFIILTALQPPANIATISSVRR